MPKPKKAIVFGGSGFLGSHVADSLTRAKYEVTIFDIKKSPFLQQSQSMIIGDILNQDQLDEAINGKDIVYNFAGISDIEIRLYCPGLIPGCIRIFLVLFFL